MTPADYAPFKLVIEPSGSLLEASKVKQIYPRFTATPTFLKALDLEERSAANFGYPTLQMHSLRSLVNHASDRLRSFVYAPPTNAAQGSPPSTIRYVGNVSSRELFQS